MENNAMQTNASSRGRLLGLAAIIGAVIIIGVFGWFIYWAHHHTAPANPAPVLSPTTMTHSQQPPNPNYDQKVLHPPTP